MRKTNGKINFAVGAILSAALVCVLMLGCSQPAKSPAVADQIRNSLNAAGLTDVKISQDRDKGIVTLDGKAMSEDAKAQAESIARSLA
jgi:hypothetical protein